MRMLIVHNNVRSAKEEPRSTASGQNCRASEQGSSLWRSVRMPVFVAALTLLVSGVLGGCSGENTSAPTKATTTVKKRTTSTGKSTTSKATSPSTAAGIPVAVPSEFCAGFAAIIDPKLSSDQRRTVLTDLVDRRDALLGATPAEIRESMSVVIDVSAIAVGKPDSIVDRERLTDASIAAAEKSVIEYHKAHC